MSRKPARIDSPEILKELRVRFVKFDEACRQALAACDAHVKSTDAWLRNDQRLALKLQMRKCDEAVAVAQSAYEQARWGAIDLSRSSGVEEKRALDKAKRRKQEVEVRIDALEKWTLRLEDAVSKLRKPCIALSNQLDFSTPRALARIDLMLDRLEDYLRPAPTEEP
jgi:hypothetical protein